MEKVILILVGPGAPRILNQLGEQKIVPRGGIALIQADLDALQHLADRNIISKSKVLAAHVRVMRNMTSLFGIGIRCALKYTKP